MSKFKNIYYHENTLLEPLPGPKGSHNKWTQWEVHIWFLVIQTVILQSYEVPQNLIHYEFLMNFRTPGKITVHNICLHRNEQACEWVRQFCWVILLIKEHVLCLQKISVAKARLIVFLSWCADILILKKPSYQWIQFFFKPKAQTKQCLSICKLLEVINMILLEFTVLCISHPDYPLFMLMT